MKTYVKTLFIRSIENITSELHQIIPDVTPKSILNIDYKLMEIPKDNRLDTIIVFYLTSDEDRLAFANTYKIFKDNIIQKLRTKFAFINDL